MNKIKVKLGDICSVNSGIIVHGCNAQGVMGSGVAKAIRLKYPQVFEDYKNFKNQFGLELGDYIPTQIISVARIHNGKKFVGIITKKRI